MEKIAQENLLPDEDFQTAIYRIANAHKVGYRFFLNGELLEVCMLRGFKRICDKCQKIGPGNGFCEECTLFGFAGLYEVEEKSAHLIEKSVVELLINATYNDVADKVLNVISKQDMIFDTAFIIFKKIVQETISNEYVDIDNKDIQDNLYNIFQEKFSKFNKL